MLAGQSVCGFYVKYPYFTWESLLIFWKFKIPKKIVAAHPLTSKHRFLRGYALLICTCLILFVAFFDKVCDFYVNSFLIAQIPKSFKASATEFPPPKISRYWSCRSNPPQWNPPRQNPPRKVPRNLSVFEFSLWIYNTTYNAQYLIVLSDKIVFIRTWKIKLAHLFHSRVNWILAPF